MSYYISCSTYSNFHCLWTRQVLPTPISKFRLGVSQVSKTRSLAFCPTCLERSAGTVEVDWGSNGAGLCSKKGSFEYRPHWFFCSIRFSVLMSSKTWTSARQRHWCWTFLLETCFSWFLVLGLRQFCRSFNLYVVEQTSAIKTRTREMLTVACSVFLFN